MPIHIDRKQMKLDAKASMRGRRPSVYLVTLLYLAIVYVLQLLSLKLQFPGLSLQEILYLSSGADPEALVDAMTAQSGVFGQLLSIAISIMEIMVGVGFTAFTLNVARGIEAGFGDLFDAFGNFFRMLWLSILMSIFIFLWSLLLIVPGIIAAYRYSMAIYILLDDPDKSALQCIRESKAMTKGYKGQLFVLDLSFIGWMLLSMIPFVSLYTMPYMGVTTANYYRVLSGRADAPEHIDYSV